MIWVLTNVWWLVPVGVGVLALLSLSHPAAVAILRRVPARAWATLAVIALLGLTFQAGRWYERRAQEAAQATAEARADRKAATVAKAATDRAGKATAKIRARAEDAADEVQREMGAIDCPDPIPDVVRDQLDAATRRAREALPAGASGDP